MLHKQERFKIRWWTVQICLGIRQHFIIIDNFEVFLMGAEFVQAKGIYSFLKISEKRYLEEMLNGHLYMNKLSFFKQLITKIDHERADNYEGAVHVLQADKVKMIIGKGQQRHELKGLTNQVFVGRNDVLSWSVFCLYAIHPGKYLDKGIDDLDVYRKYLTLHSRLKRFGDYVLFIKNPDVFCERVVAACKRDNLNLTMSPIAYYDLEKHHGAIPDQLIGLVKPDKYKHQNEYRIIIRNAPTDGPYKLDVGSLSDITTMFKFDEFNDAIEVSV